MQVAFNNQVRSSELSGDAVETKNLLRALKLFNSLCYSPEHMVTYKLREGDTAVFDNLRVMHGREGFVVEEGQDGARFGKDNDDHDNDDNDNDDDDNDDGEVMMMITHKCQYKNQEPGLGKIMMMMMVVFLLIITLKCEYQNDQG